MTSRFFYLIPFLSLVACASSPQVSTSLPSFSLAMAEKVNVGSSRLEDVRSIFGLPDRTLNTEDGVVWLYLRGAYSSTRVSFGFDGQHRVQFMHWFPEEKDSESLLENAQALASGVKLRKIDLPWTNPHMAPDEVIYRGKVNKTTFSIVYRKTAKCVESISWYRHSKKMRPSSLVSNFFRIGESEPDSR